VNLVVDRQELVAVQKQDLYEQRRSSPRT
jgi:hypothetical protein